jgi:N-hydroxyarylamine O-acetyltransferase
MNVDAYLHRLHYSGPRAPTLETLRALHHAHLLAVPFENLDIHRHTPIRLDEARFFDKIVTRRRGGFCYELNGLFAWLLRQLGFNVTLLSARVTNANGYGPEFDHLVLLVRLNERWLADVGFGDSFREPLRLDDSRPQTQPFGRYRLSAEGEQWTMVELDADGQALDGYTFTLQPRQLAEFAAMCHWQQTAPESHFVQNRVCTLATPTGRVTVSGQRLITTTDGQRHERPIADDAGYVAILHEQFGIVF